MLGVTDKQDAKQFYKQKVKDLEKKCTFCQKGETVAVCLSCGTRWCKACKGKDKTPVCWGCADTSDAGEGL